MATYRSTCRRHYRTSGTMYGKTKSGPPNCQLLQGPDRVLLIQRPQICTAMYCLRQRLYVQIHFPKTRADGATLNLVPRKCIVLDEYKILYSVFTLIVFILPLLTERLRSNHLPSLPQAGGHVYNSTISACLGFNRVGPSSPGKATCNRARHVCICLGTSPCLPYLCLY